MESIDEAARRSARLGVRIALDDFGTGIRQLGYLSRLPIDTLKIDRSFIHHMTEKADDASIVSAMICSAGAEPDRRRGVGSRSRRGCCGRCAATRCKGFIQPPGPEETARIPARPERSPFGGDSDGKVS
jgi:predicted signal transduction protein with EAL and GGDEF domain